MNGLHNNSRGWFATILCIGTLFFSSFIPNAYADDIHPTLTVIDVQSRHSNTHTPKKVYLHITEYNSTGTARAFTVPNLPLNWPARHIHPVDNLQIWGGALKENQSTSLVVLIMEHNAKPWNTDDLIGVVTINIKNQQGKLISEWTIPNRNTRPGIGQRFGYVTQQVRLNKDSDSYAIDFVLGETSRAKVIQKGPRSLLRLSST